MAQNSRESLTVIEALGALRLNGKDTVISPFIVGMALTNKKSLQHHQIEHTLGHTVATIELPSQRAQRLYSLFRHLFSEERKQAYYDNLSAFGFLIGVNEDAAAAYEPPFSLDNPVHPTQLITGEAYVVQSNEAPHGILAAENGRALHISGPQRGLAHTPIADILQIWPGTLHSIHPK